MSDFRRVGDLLFPFASTDTDLTTGKVLETTTVRSITLNPAIDPTVFGRAVSTRSDDSPLTMTMGIASADSTSTRESVAMASAVKLPPPILKGGAPGGAIFIV